MTRQADSLLDTDPGVTLVPTAENSGAMAPMFERLARDPNASVEKIERLMALWERNEARRGEALFNTSMADAQREMRPIAADASNPQTHSRYASYAALDKALRPIYTDKGFGLSFDTGDAPVDYVRVLCYVTHTGGHSRTYRADMPADGKGAKGGDVMTKTHAVGSAMSYGMRYLLKMIFNVAVGEDDDDGNAAGRTQREAPPSPGGYDAWFATLEGLASDGIAAFEKAWANDKMCPPAFRSHLAQTAPTVLASLKTKARKVKP